MEKKFKVVETLFRCGKCGNYIKAIRQYNGMKFIDDGCLEFRILKKKMPDYEYFFFVKSAKQKAILWELLEKLFHLKNGQTSGLLKDTKNKRLNK